MKSERGDQGANKGQGAKGGIRRDKERNRRKWNKKWRLLGVRGEGRMRGGMGG